MTVDEQVEMTDEQIDEFLTSRQVGVLALAHGGEPYAIPITYHYDPETRNFHFRMVYSAQSSKRHFFGDEPRSHLVVYEESPPRYRSVVAKGRPRELEDTDIDIEYIKTFGEMMRPLFELWTETRSDLEIQLYEIDPTDISGRLIDLEE